jgi:hypothetical protein
MLTLAAADTIAGGASAASLITVSMFGMEINAGTETYKCLYQGQLGNSVATIYTAPGSTVAIIKSIMIVNTDTASRTFQLFRGGTAAANAITPLITIQSQSVMSYEDCTGWQMLDYTGKLLGGAVDDAVNVIENYGPTGCKAETYPRSQCNEGNIAALSTGRLSLQLIYLTAGTVITNIGFASATTAGATLTNQIFGLYDLRSRRLLATTTNDTSTAWAANTNKVLALTPGTFTVPFTGLYYLGIMVAATTVPTLKGMTAFTASAVKGLNDITHGTSTTGVTTPLPSPCAIPAVTTTSIYGFVT